MKNIDSFFIVKRLIFISFVKIVNIFYCLIIGCCHRFDVFELEWILKLFSSAHLGSHSHSWNEVGWPVCDLVRVHSRMISLSIIISYDRISQTGPSCRIGSNFYSLLLVLNFMKIHFFTLSFIAHITIIWSFCTINITVIMSRVLQV